MSTINLEEKKNNDIGYHPLFIVTIICLFHIIIFFLNKNAVLQQITLRDFDGYWHLARAKDLYNFGNTYHTIQLRSNAPYGESLHWTSSFDLMLFAGAYIGSFFVDFNVALLWWSIMINPLLHVLSFLVLFWGLRDFTGNIRASIFGILFPFQLFLLGIFDMGVPDHHGVQIFLFSLFIALIIKSILSGNFKFFSLCGIVGGISIWFGLESIAIILIAISFFGLEWIIEGESYRTKNLLFSFVLFLTTLFLFLLDTRKDDLRDIVYDRISIVHVFLFFCITVFWIILNVLSKSGDILKNKTNRFIAATTGSVACILLMYHFFPLFFKNPLSVVNPAVKSIYLNQTSEFTGLFFGDKIHPTVSYIYWALTLPAIPLSIFFAWRHQGKEKYIWIFIAIINIVYIISAASLFRFIIYAILCALIPISYFIANIYILMNKNINHSYHRIIRTVFILTCCFSFFVPSMIPNTTKHDLLMSDPKFLSKFCNYLNSDPFFENKPRRILTSIYYGPLLLYKTQHEVIGTPGHRNVSGIIDTYNVMNTQNAENAHAIIRQRGVQVLLIGRPEYGIGDYFLETNKKSKEPGDIFHRQLWKGKIPAWLEIYPVPKSLEGKIKVFRVIG
jgi:asparagine N-glycosylation enzyme membrane subunit Stt3